MIGHSEVVAAAPTCYRHASSLPLSRYVSIRDEAPTHDHYSERSIPHFNPAYGGSMFFRNGDTHLPGNNIVS